MTESRVVEVLIVGAGPAGISVAAQCAYHGVGDILLVEKGPSHNQTVLQYYPDDKRVDAAYRGQEAICAGVLCFRDTTKPNFLAIVDQMLARYPFAVRYNVHVDSIQKGVDGLFAVSTSEGEVIKARFVAVTIGRMGKPNRPDYFNTIPAKARMLVQFDVRNLTPEGKHFLVVGGGNSAIEFALSLSGKAKLVTVSYRKNAFSRLNPMNLSLLKQDEKNGNIRVLRNSEIEKILEQDGKPQCYFAEGGAEVFDHVVFGIGGSSPAAFLQSAGIELDPRGNPRLSPSLETNVDNLFVAGELAVAPGKGSIIVSFNTGKVAADAITTRLGIERKPDVVHVT
ncbi:MAG: NAD(P)-binding domain-containing protein [Planctomycetia bacterium]|nr:NAD(P)-binding domain-containing protein [Planctomycetia bacterium]